MKKKNKAPAKKKKKAPIKRKEAAQGPLEKTLSPVVHPITELLEHKNFVQFFSRLLVAIFVFGFALTLLDSWLSATAGSGVFEANIDAFRVSEINLLIGSMYTQVFFLIILYLIAKPKLYALSKVKTSRYWYAFALLAAVSFAVYAYTKALIVFSPAEAQAMFLFIFAGKYLALTLTVVFLVMALLDKETILKGVKRFWKEAIIAMIFIQIFNKAALTLLYSYELFQNEWIVFAMITTVGSAFLLSLLFPGRVSYNFESIYRPVLMAPGFSGIIARSCSGLIGLSLFSLLFGLILVIDWRHINKQKAVLAFALGILGVIGVNIIRITLLFLAGIFISVKFALCLFHTNIGLILFLIYFLVFEFYTYKWLRR